MKPFGIIIMKPISFIFETPAMTNAPQATFRALSDPTRRGILKLLSHKDMTIGEVSERFAMTRPAVRKHLAILEESGLIEVRAEGRRRLNHLNPQGLVPAIDWFAEFDTFWDDRLSALKTAIEKDLK